MKKAAHRPGDVAPNSGTRGTFSLDQRTRDRLAWQEHVIKRLLQADAGTSVLLRRAVEVYTRHLEKLIRKPEAERLQREVYALERATRGEREAIPAQGLIEVPLKTFSDIAAEESRKRAEQAKAKLFQPPTYEEIRNV